MNKKVWKENCNKYAKYIVAQPSYSEQFRADHTFTKEILKAISLPSIVGKMANVGSVNMVKRLEGNGEIEIVSMNFMPDFSCNLTYRELGE